MPATTPEEICRLFQQYMAEGDVDSVLSVYDPEAVFLNRSGEIRRGEEALREELAPFASFHGMPEAAVHALDDQLREAEMIRCKD